DLIDVDAKRLQAFGDTLEEGAYTRQAAKIVCGFLQAVGIVEGRDRSVGLALKQRKFRLDSREQRPAALCQPGDLRFQDISCVDRMRLAVDRAGAHQTRVSRS